MKYEVKTSKFSYIEATECSHRDTRIKTSKSSRRR